MRLTKRRARRNLVLLALVVFLSLASSISVGSISSVAQATTRYPACVTSQIVVTAGVTISNVSYQYPTQTGNVHAFSKMAVPVFFYNRGPVCHLLMGAPDIAAVRDATSASTVTVANMTIPNPPLPTTKRVVLQLHQRAEALFLFGSTIPKGAADCQSETATGLLVQGYAKPVPSVGKFFPRRMKNVCFPVPGAVGAAAMNTGVAWTTAPSPSSGGVRVLYVLLWVLLSLGVIGGLFVGTRFITRRASASRERSEAGSATGDLTPRGTASVQTGPRGSAADSCSMRATAAGEQLAAEVSGGDTD